MARRKYRIGVDVGGTFTDLVVVNEETGSICTLKVPSSPSDPSEAVTRATWLAQSELNVSLEDVTQFTHATTIASNTILEGSGARTALLTTEGFRDILEIQRHKRYELFNLSYRKLAPLVPRRLCLGIPERIGAQGQIVSALDEGALRNALSFMAEEKIESVAICFLFSFLNDKHERRALEMARELLPGCYITISSEVFPQYREYERASTTVVNAYLGPRVSSYLERMIQELKAAGLRVPLHLMQSNGGIIRAEDAKRVPYRIVESGPAAGVIAAAFLGRVIGREKLIAFDMGGTTAKAGLIEEAQPRQTVGHEVGGGINLSRLLQGGGYYIGAATVDLAEVSAGGGSIAWIDGGFVKVGPQSAGAHPGPVCYGFGGEKVTVTDANVILGRIPADFFLGGKMRLDVARARAGVEEQLALPLGLSIEEACAGVIEVANANMLKMLRIVSVEKGYDPREFSFIAFGGAGPAHAVSIAEDLGIGEVIIPPTPGLLSALGLLVADVQFDFRQTHVCSAEDVDLRLIQNLYDELERNGHKALEEHGTAQDDITIVRRADMRYVGQAYEISVSIPSGPLTEKAREMSLEAFHRSHERIYGRAERRSRVELVNLCVTAVGKIRPPELRPLSHGIGSGAAARKRSRPVFFKEMGYIDCPCYERSALDGGARIAGPAIIEAFDSTTVIPPAWSLRCDQLGNLFLTPKG
ncbi:MAG: hydantoinase/oxoprolinase family protein [Deltaproteobacteria bacterium]|nr:hydantoinase/oxoprolinase family protein [Deltaproteobacteria bacterium]